MKFRIPRYIIATRDSPVKVYSETGFVTDNIDSVMMFKNRLSEIPLALADGMNDTVWNI